VIETGSGALVGIEVKASATVNAGDFKGLRKLADACDDNFKLGVVLSDGGTPVPFGDRFFCRANVLLMGVTRFARSSGHSDAGVAIRHYIPGSNDGLDFHTICGLQKEPTSEKSRWIENTAF
jgi:hypothetical protein